MQTSRSAFKEEPKIAFLSNVFARDDSSCEAAGVAEGHDQDISQPATAPPEPSQNVLLSAQLELTNESKELKDALLRMRKKLLSLSSAAAAAAG
jgi:hypothetical protein